MEEKVIKTARAEAKTVHMSARKVRLVLDLIRGKTVSQAYGIISLVPNVATEPISKVIKSAVANATNNYDMKADALYIKEIYANESTTIKRWRARAKGSGTKILKRTCNIACVVAEKE